MHDLVVRGGQVVDGTGGPRRLADVAISDGRVVLIDRNVGPARRTLDVDGQIVAPGFIDVHTHLDVQAFWDPTLSPSALHGVTTVVGGNCGFSVAPLTDDDASYIMRMLARVEGMPLEALELGVPWDWRTTEEYLKCLEGRMSVNAGFMVGHSAIRRVVMGAAATERTATDKEIAAMKDLLAEGLRAGGLGFSSSKTAVHTDAEGRLVPSTLAGSEEILALASVCRDYEGTSLEFVPEIGPFSDETSELMIGMTVMAQRPLNWNLIQATAKSLPDLYQKLELGTRARKQGGNIVGLMVPMAPVSRLNFRSGFVLDALPGWLEPMSRLHDEKLRMLADPAQRRRLNQLAQQPSNMSHISDWANVVIVETFAPDTKRYEGRIVGDIAGEESKDPFDALLDIVCADDLRTQFSRQRKDDTPADWQAKAELWRDDRVLIGGSDAGAHLDMLATFNYATVLLEQGVRNRGLLSTEEAVHLLTDAPARLYGLRDRGRLREGAHADIAIFDDDTVGTEPVHVKFDLPGGAGRLYAGSHGVGHVLVNGVEVVTDGEYTDARPGTVIRSGRDTQTPLLVEG
jgi:N-acyl-D-aspartate/D-glutamate deacylase